MVVGKPYIRFKINNEPETEALDYNHTWATTVETNKGPIDTPVLITSAAQAKSIFNVDMTPYFAQGAQTLIMVRVAAHSASKQPSKSSFNFVSERDIYFAMAQQATLQKTVNDETYEHELFYIEKTDGTNKTYEIVLRYKDSNGNVVPDMFVDKWFDDGRAITEAEVKADGERVVAQTNAQAASDDDRIDTTAPDYNPASYSTLTACTEYDSTQVKPLLVPKKYKIPANTALINLSTIYEGEYDIQVSCGSSFTADDAGHYNIYITETPFGTISIRDVNDLSKIVARINNAGLNVDAILTEDGAIVNQAMHSHPVSIATANVSIDGTQTSFITSDINSGAFIKLAQQKTTPNDVVFLTETEERLINADELNANVENYTAQATVDYLPYAMNLANVGAQSFVGGSNGEWDEATGRIPTTFQADAHARGLKTLQRIRLAGVFCMYGEELIQNEYIKHGINEQEPEKGMNNNETCKWRTILLGANADERTDIASLVTKAQSLNNQYILFLGQGLIDTGYTGDVASMSQAEKTLIGATSDFMLLPYECTQYIAGLRAKLEYYESIFGGQGRKRIRSVGTLDIAPLFSYETAYEWNPNAYTTLNEAGVLTFTEEYGNITLTDGVTTIQQGFEEDEEGVMNILKYAANAIYDVCLPYIGRNINADLENSINMAVESVLSSMKNDDQSLVDTDEYNAYTVSVSLGSRSNQLLGKIYIYLAITPVHALRQIEVEMTVQ